MSLISGSVVQVGERRISNVLLGLATPGPPYALAVNAVTKRYVDLQWEAPKNDGGRPILRWPFFTSYFSSISIVKIQPIPT